MRVVILLVTSVLAAVGAAAQQQPVLRPPQNQEGPIRQINRPFGKRIIDQLRPSDVVVTVVDWSPTPSSRGPSPGMTAAQSITKAVSFAGVIKVSDLSGRFNEPGDWIETMVTGEIVEVLKGPGSVKSHKGDSIGFQVSGGEVVFGKTLIRAIKPQMDFFVVDKLYFVFADLRDGALWSDPRSSMLIDGDKLIPLSNLGMLNEVPKSFNQLRALVAKHAKDPIN